MVPQWIIEKKREGFELSADEIEYFIDGYNKGEIPDYQMSALAMAICFNGMSESETVSLTKAMLYSGVVINSVDLPGFKVDKHSTGGIGDKISLILAPLAAACGLTVPMISGRGLGVTGGTVDKLDSIPGYKTSLSIDDFKNNLKICGCSMIGQTSEIAPADKKLYALRDVTATVSSIPLITASILSKKLAEGIDALLMDVKFGTGAFMKTEDDALALAKSLISVGEGLGCKVSAIITDMNQPLGRVVGNSLEVQEAIEVLNGKGPDDVRELTIKSVAQMLMMRDSKVSRLDCEKIVAEKLDDGSAFKKWSEMLLLHGADLSKALPTSKIKKTLYAESDGFVEFVDAEKIGKAFLLLGAGRIKTDDEIDYSAGISNLVQCGDKIAKNQQLCTLHAIGSANMNEVESLLFGAIKIGQNPVKERRIISRIID